MIYNYVNQERSIINNSQSLLKELGILISPLGKIIEGFLLGKVIVYLVVSIYKN